MKVYIKNKVSFGGDSAVVDENQNQIFHVKGKVVSATRVKYLCDNAGNRLYKIRNKWINLFVHKAFIYDAEDKKIATVKDKWLNLKGDLIVKGCDGEIKINGKFMGPTLEIIRNGEVIGVIRRQIAIFVDSFELEANPEDLPFLVALVIAMDNITDKK